MDITRNKRRHVEDFMFIKVLRYSGFETSERKRESSSLEALQVFERDVGVVILLKGIDELRCRRKIILMLMEAILRAKGEVSGCYCLWSLKYEGRGQRLDCGDI